MTELALTPVLEPNRFEHAYERANGASPTVDGTACSRSFSCLGEHALVDTPMTGEVDRGA